MKESVTYQKILSEGEAKEKIRIALNMIHSNISTDLIAEITGLSVEEIERLR